MRSLGALYGQRVFCGVLSDRQKEQLRARQRMHVMQDLRTNVPINIPGAYHLAARLPVLRTTSYFPDGGWGGCLLRTKDTFCPHHISRGCGERNARMNQRYEIYSGTGHSKSFALAKETE